MNWRKNDLKAEILIYKKNLNLDIHKILKSRNLIKKSFLNLGFL